MIDQQMKVNCEGQPDIYVGYYFCDDLRKKRLKSSSFLMFDQEIHSVPLHLLKTTLKPT